MSSLSEDDISVSLACVRAYLDYKDLEYVFESRDYLFTVNQEHDAYSDKFYFKIYTNRHEFGFHIVADFSVPEECFTNVIEYITRVNLGLMIGNFEFDYLDGNVRFKSSVRFLDTTLSELLVRNVVDPALLAWETYFPGIIEVILEVESPASALEKIDTQSALKG